MKKCRNRGCDNEFVQHSTFQNQCVPCLIKKGRKIEAKEERKEHRKAKAKLMTKSDHHKLTQATFNKWTRLSDKTGVCISCQKPPKKSNAGHYRSVGAEPSLRYEPDNCWLQCEYCNTHLSSNAIEYRINLVKLIGVERVEWLEGPHEPKKYTIDDLKQIRQYYAKLSRELERETL